MNYLNNNHKDTFYSIKVPSLNIVHEGQGLIFLICGRYYPSQMNSKKHNNEENYMGKKQ